MKKTFHFFAVLMWSLLDKAQLREKHPVRFSLKLDLSNEEKSAH